MIELHPETEIRTIPALDAEQSALLDNHSALNVVNVLVGELNLLGLALDGDPALFTESLEACEALACDLRSTLRPAAWAEAADGLARSIEADLDSGTRSYAHRLELPGVAHGLRSLSEVLAILRIRSQEVLARSREPGRWGRFEPEELRRSFVQVFAAMQCQCRHRFRVVYSRVEKGPSDYLIEMDFRRGLRRVIQMPPVMVDVLRDLLANARKYTAPGGCIRARIDETEAELHCAVEDSGRGIPESELERVVAFGYRGSNVADVRTLGGGFGLTKAFVMTRRFGGRFWIASRLGSGTRVRLSLPLPDSSRN